VKESNDRGIEWTDSEPNELVWKFPSENFAWNSQLIVHENQAAAIFTGQGFFARKLRMYDFFSTGKYTLSPNSVPLMVSAFPEINARVSLACHIIFCSTKEYSYSSPIYTGYSLGQGSVAMEAEAQCRLRIFSAELFFKNVVAAHKKLSTAKVVKYLKKGLGDELIRLHWPSEWISRRSTPLENKWRDLGIELLELEFDSYKEEGVGTLT